MGKPTAEDTAKDIKNVDLDKNDTKSPVRPKSEYSRKERRTIRIGLTVMVLIFIGAVFYLLGHTENTSSPAAEQTDAQVTDNASPLLDKLEIQQISDDGTNTSYDHIVFFSDAIEHFVPVEPIPETIYLANIVKVDSSTQIDEQKLADELEDTLLDESFEAYSPEKPEISANDDVYGIRRYRNATIYCTIQVVSSGFLEVVVQTAETAEENQAGYVKKMCADENDLRHTAARLQEFYDKAMGEYELPEGTEYDPTILVLDSGTRLSPIDGYEYKEGFEGIVGSTAASGIVFTRFEQQEWEAFRFDGMGHTVCDDFDTELVQNALVGYTCINPDTDAETTVGAYYDLV